MTGRTGLRSRRWLVVMLIVLALAGCSQSTARQVGKPYSPSTPGDIATRPEHGGGDGGGGGGGM
jgi:hypothetical protein